MQMSGDGQNPRTHQPMQMSGDRQDPGTGMPRRSKFRLIRMSVVSKRMKKDLDNARNIAAKEQQLTVDEFIEEHAWPSPAASPSLSDSAHSSCTPERQRLQQSTPQTENSGHDMGLSRSLSPLSSLWGHLQQNLYGCEFDDVHYEDFGAGSVAVQHGETQLDVGGTASQGITVDRAMLDEQMTYRTVLLKGNDEKSSL